MPTASFRARMARPVLRVVQSRQNARVKDLRAAFSRPGRSETGHIAIEGEHLLCEAIASGLHFTTVFVQTGSEAILDRLSLPDSAEVLALPPGVFASAVGTESPQGIAALVEPLSFSLDQVLAHAENTTPLIVVSAGLQDPGNLGTLVRTAEAFGATGFVLLPGTVSLFNQKTLRASSGSVFRLPCVSAQSKELFAALSQRSITPIAAVAADGEPLTKHDLTRASAIILGNEGSGIPGEILQLIERRVTIPMPGPVESLNAAIAGSILLYEAARQRTKP
jgi:RNA methyltransferase, TrmH family